MPRLPVDRVFLIFIFLIPLLPRPSAPGIERYVLPIVLLLVIATWLLWWPKQMPRGGAKLQLLAAVMLFSVGIFATRILIHANTEEIGYLVSRILFSAGLFSLVHWFCTTNVDPKTVLRYFLYGFTLTSLIAIFVGITGVELLEPDSVVHSRYFGFYKTTGIFRSYGEFGIMGSFAWAYLLIYRKDFRFASWFTLSAIILFALFLAQSRNTYLVVALTTALVVALRTVTLPAYVRVALPIMVIMIQSGVDIGLPILKQTTLGRVLVGAEDSMLESNIEYRSDQFSHAFEFAIRDPMATVLGHPRVDWTYYTFEEYGHEIAPHNHFLSNLLFLGLLGGGVWIVGLFLLPPIRVLQFDITGQPFRQLAIVGMMGAIAGLSFYEGFFSSVVMLAIGLTWSLAFGVTAEIPLSESDRGMADFRAGHPESISPRPVELSS